MIRIEAVWLHADAVPSAQVARRGGQRLQQRCLQREQAQRSAPGGTVAAPAGLQQPPSRACALRSAKSRKVRSGRKLGWSATAATFSFVVHTDNGREAKKRRATNGNAFPQADAATLSLRTWLLLQRDSVSRQVHKLHFS